MSLNASPSDWIATQKGALVCYIRSSNTPMKPAIDSPTRIALPVADGGPASGVCGENATS